MKLSRIALTLPVFLMPGCSKPAAKEPSASSSAFIDNLFVWNRPASPAANLPIGQTATCRFKKGLAASFQKVSTKEEPNGPERVYYMASDENEADTVAFLDLDTNTPKVQSNGGQAPLKVLYKDGKMLTLIHTAQRPLSGGTEVYTIFRDKGIVIMSQQQDALDIGPLGVIEMGYCN
jgi:hypothetical protein